MMSCRNSFEDMKGDPLELLSVCRLTRVDLALCLSPRMLSGAQVERLRGPALKQRDVPLAQVLEGGARNVHRRVVLLKDLVREDKRQETLLEDLLKTRRVETPHNDDGR